MFQVLNAFGSEPAAVRGLATIPLFARFLGSACVAGVLGPIIGLGAADPERSLRQIPRTLAIAITLIIATSVGFP
jgi:hypothetical protein